MMISGASVLSGSGENMAMCILTLDDWDRRTTPDTRLNAIIAQMQARTRRITDANIICLTPPAIMGLGMTGGASFYLCGIGNVDAEALSQTAKTFAMKVAANPEVMYAMTPFNTDTPQLYLDIDREKAETLGVEVNTIFNTLQSKLASLYINDFTMASRNFKVKMQSPATYRSTLNDIHEIQVRNDGGDMVPLSSLGTLRFVTGPQQITRFNKMKGAEINAQAAPGFSSEKLYDVIDKTEKPNDYQIGWTGLSYQERQNEGQIVYLMIMALLFAYLFLVGQYESWSIPISAMLTVGFAVLGALIGLLLTGETLSIYAQLGVVMLIGLAAKNAILMIEFSKQEREAGRSVYEAAINGANMRYRAVLMTAYSFLFGVFPLVIASGAGSGSRRAIGITTFSGMLLATLVGIIFTPALYAAFQRIREWVKRKIKSN